MEWLVPILFVVLSLAQWWLKHRQAGTPNVDRPVESPEPLDEFGDLMEALGRRRHESPPTSPVQPKSLPPLILPSLSRIPETPVPVLAVQSASLPPRSLSSSRAVESRIGSFARLAPQPIDLRRAIVLSEILAPAVTLR
jgi:hypothetical protein